MRIVVPDLRLWCKNYMAENQSFFDWYRETYLGDDKKFYSTNAAIFMGMLHNHQHKMAYDAETLSKILEEIGFYIENSNCEWGVGSIPDLQFLEQKDNPRKFESLIFECVKRK
jgi:predicted SAM-dependent methyltransferase